MDLITDLKDERLSWTVANIAQTNPRMALRILIDSLRASLTREAEKDARIRELEEREKWLEKELHDATVSLETKQSRLAASEAQLCRAREKIGYVGTIRGRGTILGEVAAILNSTGPCRHEAKVARLDGLLSDACKLLDSALGDGPDCDCIFEGNAHFCGWTKWQDATRKFLDAERAALAAKEGG